MPVPFPNFEYIDEARSLSPNLETTENKELEPEETSYLHNEPRIFIDSLGHTYSDMKSNQEPYSTYAKVITIPRKKAQEPVTFTSRHTITLISMATLTSFTTIVETKHLGPVDPLPKVTSKITTYITITAVEDVKDHSTGSAWTSWSTIDLNPPSPSSNDESTNPSLWSTVTISDTIPSSSTLTTSYTTSQEQPDLPTTTESSSSNAPLTTAGVVGVAIGVCVVLGIIGSLMYRCLQYCRNQKGTNICFKSPHGVSRFSEMSRSSSTPSNWTDSRELKTVFAPHRSTEANILLTTDTRCMSFDIDEDGYNKGFKYYKGEASSSRNPDGYNSNLGQDPQWKGKERAE